MIRFRVPELFRIGGGLLLIALVACSAPPSPASTSVLPSATLTVSASPTLAATQTPYVITATSFPQPIPTAGPQSVYIFSLAEAGHEHLFAYNPQSLPLTRLTSGDWDDITPALSPDGTRIAFASNRNGYWDLYLLDLQSGETTRLTDTPEFDAAPSWSPDGVWLVFESYKDGNLQLMILSVKDPSQPVIRLTQDAASDSYPAWSPSLPGRKIAFVSDRSGQNEIWIADLDKQPDQRYSMISQNAGSFISHPAWSTDGRYVSWSAIDPTTALSGIYVWDVQDPSTPAQLVGNGDWPVWLSGQAFATRLTSANQTYLTAYTLPQGAIMLPTIQLPAALAGLTYGTTAVALPGPFDATAALTPAPLFRVERTQVLDIPAGRDSLVDLNDVNAPYPKLDGQVVDSFQALRERLTQAVGWDVLGTNLENAFIPLTTPLDPGMGQDWLYTGRAFTLNSNLLEAGWMVVVREDFGSQTYWHLFLRTRAQDGSQGQPLTEFPWDFSARTDPTAYDQGGRLSSSIPTGYWLDLTDLALEYGWERQPALINWRTFFDGTRFNEFAMTGGLDWRTAMLALYPPDVLVTPTVVVPPSPTPTWVPPWYQSPTPTTTATLQPTLTP
jgi:TolB protein